MFVSLFSHIVEQGCAASIWEKIRLEFTKCNANLDLAQKVPNWLIDKLNANENEHLIFQQDEAQPPRKVTVRAYQGFPE